MEARSFYKKGNSQNQKRAFGEEEYTHLDREAPVLEIDFGKIDTTTQNLKRGTSN